LISTSSISGFGDQRKTEGVAMPRKRLKVCYIAPEGGSPHVVPRKSGQQVAALERVDNVRVTPLASGIFGPQRAAVEKLTLWDNGRTLRVKFLDGDPDVQTKVTQIAKEWEAVANITLDFVTSGASEVRISFLQKGFSWSTVGTDALTVSSTQPTMNYGWLTASTALREYQRVVRHEFGHALVMIHEHQNPAAAGVIPWDKPKVYAYYAQQGWTKSDVDHNIFATYAADATNFTAFDPTSIMEYAIPDELTIGSYAIGWNTELSAQDRSFMAKQYPMASPGTVELEIGGPRYEADLSVGAEVDTYHFQVGTPATFIMTTEGPTDTVLTVQGPNDPGAIVAWDDDRGAGLNARIVRKLYEGDYWLTVKHKDPGNVPPDSTGTYTVGLKQRKS
jgi:hypothetical protein